jgi:hypothetical protein
MQSSGDSVAIDNGFDLTAGVNGNAVDDETGDMFDTHIKLVSSNFLTRE